MTLAIFLKGKDDEGALRFVYLKQAQGDYSVGNSNLENAMTTYLVWIITPSQRLEVNKREKQEHQCRRLAF